MIPPPESSSHPGATRCPSPTDLAHLIDAGPPGRRFGATVADQSAPVLERIEHLTVCEDLGEELFACADETAWLARLAAAVGKKPH